MRQRYDPCVLSLRPQVQDDPPPPPLLHPAQLQHAKQQLRNFLLLLCPLPPWIDQGLSHLLRFVLLRLRHRRSKQYRQVPLLPSSLRPHLGHPAPPPKALLPRIFVSPSFAPQGGGISRTSRRDLCDRVVRPDDALLEPRSPRDGKGDELKVEECLLSRPSPRLTVPPDLALARHPSPRTLRPRH